MRQLCFNGHVFDVETRFESFGMDELIHEGRYEPWVANFAEIVTREAEKPVIFDVGANVGLESLPFSTIGNDVRVVAFEALPQAARLLEKNARRNRVTNICVVNRAVSSEAGRLEINLPHTGILGDAFISQAARSAEHSVGVTEVDAVTIDDYVAQEGVKKLDLIKIDVEGWEEHVLKGARSTIEKLQPAVLIEFNSTELNLESEKRSFALMKSINSLFKKRYLIDRRDEKLVEIRSYSHLRSLMLSGHQVEDLLCFPTAQAAKRVRRYVKQPTYSVYYAATAQVTAQGIISFLSRYPDGWNHGQMLVIVSGVGRPVAISGEMFWYAPEESEEENRVVVSVGNRQTEHCLSQKPLPVTIELPANGVAFLWCSRSRQATEIWSNDDPRVLGFNFGGLKVRIGR